MNAMNTTVFPLEPAAYIFMFFFCVALMFGWKGVLIVIAIPVILVVIIGALGAAESWIDSVKNLVSNKNNNPPPPPPPPLDTQGLNGGKKHGKKRK